VKLLAYAPRDATLTSSGTRLGLLTDAGIRCEIERIGVLENTVVDELPRADDHAVAAGVAELLGLAR
jgi:hypothetical protein